MKEELRPIQDGLSKIRQRYGAAAAAMAAKAAGTAHSPLAGVISESPGEVCRTAAVDTNDPVYTDPCTELCRLGRWV